MGLDRNPHIRHTAGVDAETYRDYAVGQRVMTPDGIPGTITAVHDGPFPGTESYEVTLDDGLGGGEYDGGSLLAIEGNQAARTTAAGEQIGEYVVPGPDPDPTKHVASEDYPELTDILVERPPLAHAEPMVMHASKTAAVPLTCGDCGQTYFTDGEPHGCAKTAAEDVAPFEGPPVIATEAGLWDHVVAPVLDRATRHIDKKYPGIEQGRVWSYDWCRFRRERQCYYPKEMDLAATQQAGYAVWVPFHRGTCGRDKWDDQRNCPVSEPGPNSREPNPGLDATVPWSEGGQRGGVWASRNDADHVFEFTAAWADVRAKASQIRSSGGVRVLSISGDKATGRTVTGEVRGDSHVYETSIQSEPGRYNVAMWTCGCPWAAYSWGRSGRWKKYEGRMCSHALALSYEAQTHRLMENPDVGDWSSDQVKRPGDYSADAQGYVAAKRPAEGTWRAVSTDGWLGVSPAVRIAHAMLAEGSRDQEVVLAFGPYIHAEAKTLDFKGRLKALVRGVVKTVQEIVTETGEALFTDGTRAPVRDLLYPSFHPSLGLTAKAEPVVADPIADALAFEAELRDEPEAALPSTTGDEEDVDDGGDADGAQPEADDDGGAPSADLPQDGLPQNLALSTESRAWLLDGSSDKDAADIARAAEAVLAKSAVKTFTPAEQDEIINEGEGVTAANLDALDLEGTHYLAVEQALAAQEDEEDWLS